jgi:hypothetical protein
VRRLDAAFLLEHHQTEYPHSAEDHAMVPAELLRDRLIERIRRLSQERLVALEKFLTRIDEPAIPPPQLSASGVASPLCSNVWPHAPSHRISEHGTWFVTAGTLHKRHRFRTAQRLDLLEGGTAPAGQRARLAPGGVGRILQPLPLRRLVGSGLERAEAFPRPPAHRNRG